LTREGILTVAPAADSFLGQPVVSGAPESQHLLSVKVREHDHAFAAALILHRCQETLRQEVLFASLPGGRALTFERFVARADVTVEALDQGFLRIVNERFPLLAPNCRGRRTLYSPQGATEYRGWIGAAEADDVLAILDAPAWLNVDDRLGIRATGTGRTVYLNRHHFRPYRAVADDLTLSRLPGPTAVRRGDVVSSLASLLLPERTAAETADATFSVHLSAGGDAVCLATDTGFAAASFGPVSGRCTFVLPRPAAVPLLPGATVEVRGAELRVSVLLEARGAALFLVQERRPVPAGRDLRLDVMPDGTTYVAEP
jgi:hypothetical protein